MKNNVDIAGVANSNQSINAQRTKTSHTNAQRAKISHVNTQRIKIAVFVSGNGSNLQALIDAVNAETLQVDIVLVVFSNEKAYGIKRAEKAGIETLIFSPQDYADPKKVDTQILQKLQERQVQYLALAGYMRKITPVLLEAYPDKIINLHPALLPAHKGAHAIEEAFEAGEKVTGITFHFIDENYDEGTIIFQHEVSICSTDTLESLEEKIHEQEHKYYPLVLQAVITQDFSSLRS